MSVIKNDTQKQTSYGIYNDVIPSNLSSILNNKIANDLQTNHPYNPIKRILLMQFSSLEMPNIFGLIKVGACKQIYRHQFNKTKVSKKIKFSVIILCCLTLFSCFQYKEVEMLGVTDFGIKKFSAKGIEIEIAMQVKNPNNYKISIVKSDLELFSRGNRIGTANITNKIVLPKKSNQIHRFIVTTTIKDMASSALPLLMGILGKNTIDLQIKGDIKAKAKGISKKIPIDFKKRVKL